MLVILIKLELNLGLYYSVLQFYLLNIYNDENDKNGKYIYQTFKSPNMLYYSMNFYMFLIPA